MDMTGKAKIRTADPNGVIRELVIPRSLVTDIQFRRHNQWEPFAITVTFLPDENPEWETIFTPKLDWLQGPTDADPDPRKMWHNGCGGEVYYLGGVHICDKCKLTDKDENK